MRTPPLTPTLAAAALVLASTSATAGEAEAAMVANTCAGCHGTRGMSAGQAPVIAGLPKPYLKSTMLSYKDGSRYSTIMGRIARGYSEAEIDAMAGWFADQPWEPAAQRTDAALAARGEAIYDEKLCAGCHGPSGIRSDDTTPPLAGQYADYMYFQLQDYADPDRAIPESGRSMRAACQGLEDAELKALAHYLASQQ